MPAKMRAAQLRDLHRIEEIVRAAYEPYERRIGRRPGPMSDDYDAVIREGQAYVAEDEAGIRGLIVLVASNGRLLLQNIAVDPSCHGEGLGTMMLRFAEQFARERGFRSIELYTNELMTENLRLYSRRGYCETHRNAEDGFRRVYMSKQL